MPDFLFRSAVIKTTADGSQGKAIRLERADADMEGTVRRPLRLRLAGRLGDSGETGSVETTIEMSRSEAYAFSEWLDATVTHSFAEPVAKRGSKDKENE